VVVTTGAIGRVKLQSNPHHQPTNTQFLQAGCLSCQSTNSVKALKGKALKGNQKHSKQPSKPTREQLLLFFSFSQPRERLNDILQAQYNYSCI